MIVKYENINNYRRIDASNGDFISILNGRGNSFYKSNSHGLMTLFEDLEIIL